ncbi:MAG: GNAT family N-acyltransferase [Ramlibacter sp.]
MNKPACRPITVSWARDVDEVREAQRLRFAVFSGEMGARLHTPVPGHDIDRFDDYCEHLLVRATSSKEVIGTYRVLTPAQAVRAGGTYTANEFNLAPLGAISSRMAELGRSCVHRDHRQGPVILALWSALARFMDEHDLDTMIGCASMPLQGGSSAAGVWDRVRHTHLAPALLRVQPHLPLPLPDYAAGAPWADPPALIKGYLRLGAKVLGPPAWDPDFQTADLPMLMRMADLPARYRRQACAA